MKRFHFSIFMLTLLMLPFFVEAQNVTVTVDGKAIDNIKGVTVAIVTDTTPEPPTPEPPTPEPPIPPREWCRSGTKKATSRPWP